jgi:hypothetical protein
MVWRWSWRTGDYERELLVPFSHCYYFVYSSEKLRDKNDLHSKIHVESGSVMQDLHSRINQLCVQSEELSRLVQTKNVDVTHTVDTESIFKIIRSVAI